ncbi:uncharacterized protein LOC129587338 [Paramacrobiotus metropolitanus]|uniref:uncharacterized protein LOC129587338 n=1 Tax=Paramacrobiotus metropolitanus TaxID=2943436 RepID=UPI0024457236|nr:uncharacterized protein LOC129587338 [Paramacrobiotus metropolitanus]
MELPVALGLPRFRRLLASVNDQTISYQNTVTVLTDEGAWWLGFIEDFDEHRVLVHFDSTTVQHCWIPAGRVWPHFFLHSKHTSPRSQSGVPGMRVHVALRDEDNGPFRFRPATWLDSVSACKMHYVVLDAVDGAGAPAQRVEVVDFCQVSSSLPPTEMNRPIPPSAYPMPQCGTHYTKYILGLPGAQLMLQEPGDALRVIQCLRASNAMLGRLVPDYCRFHLQIGIDCCVVVFDTCGFRLNCRSEQESLDRLYRTLQTHVGNAARRRDMLPPTDQRMRSNPRERVALLSDADQPAAGDVNIQHVPYCIMSEAFTHLELHTQASVGRVCALWQQLLTAFRPREHVTLTFAACTTTYRHTDPEDACSVTIDHWARNENYCFRLASLLNRDVTSATKSLTVTGTNLCIHNVDFLISFLTIRNIRLPLVIIKDFTNSCFAHTVNYRSFRYSRPSQLWDRCEAVLLLNGRVSGIFRDSIFSLFICRGERRALPLHARHWMNPRLQELTMPLFLCRLPLAETPMMSIDALQITIPRLRLPWRQGYWHVLSRLMWAVNEHCPPVVEAVYVKVQTVYARWVLTLVYPEQWDTIRSYLQVFHGFHTDGTPRLWTTVDLRTVNVRRLSKLAVLGISEMFSV